MQIFVVENNIKKALFKSYEKLRYLSASQMLWFAYRGEQRQTMHRHTMYQQTREIRHKKCIVCKQTLSVRLSFSTICRRVDCISDRCWIEYQVQNDVEQPTIKTNSSLSEYLSEQVPLIVLNLDWLGQRYNFAYERQLSSYYVLFI